MYIVLKPSLFLFPPKTLISEKNSQWIFSFDEYARWERCLVSVNKLEVGFFITNLFLFIPVISTSDHKTKSLWTTSQIKITVNINTIFSKLHSYTMIWRTRIVLLNFFSYPFLIHQLDSYEGSPLLSKPFVVDRICNLQLGKSSDVFLTLYATIGRE